MDDMGGRRDDIVGTTDYLEAITVFKSAKNMLFVVIVLALLLILGCFFVASSRYALYDGNAGSETAAPAIPMAKNIEEVTNQVATYMGATDANVPRSQAMTPPIDTAPTPLKPVAGEGGVPARVTKPLKIKFEWIRWVLRVSNFAAMVATMLYSLILIFCLKISLVGRLGGINHIARAFIWSLAAVVLLMPWQKYFGGVLAGAVFTPAELAAACTSTAPRDVLEQIFFYARFAALPVAVLLMMMAAQARSVRWAKATLRRLGVM